MLSGLERQLKQSSARLRSIGRQVAVFEKIVDKHYKNMKTIKNNLRYFVATMAKMKQEGQQCCAK